MLLELPCMGYNKEIKPKSMKNESFLHLPSREIDIFQFCKKQIRWTVPFLSGFELKYAATETSLVLPEKREKVIGYSAQTHGFCTTLADAAFNMYLWKSRENVQKNH